ncbi:MAG: hypothetical protein KatS3mg110_1239 [Pirellulaceae bacterium]|nr:MAG: hypothetical protein KatS3mg110_1239 [Pirellulaceae bacterium]
MMKTQELVRGQELARLGGSAVGKSRVNINRETQHNLVSGRSAARTAAEPERWVALR